MNKEAYFFFKLKSIKLKSEKSNYIKLHVCFQLYSLVNWQQWTQWSWYLLLYLICMGQTKKRIGTRLKCPKQKENSDKCVWQTWMTPIGMSGYFWNKWLWTHINNKYKYKVFPKLKVLYCAFGNGSRIENQGMFFLCVNYAYK